MSSLERQRENPRPVPLIPDGPLRALADAVDQCTRKGPITIELLTGKPKAIIVPWCGDLEHDAASFNPERGDGEALYTEPGADLWNQLPKHMTPTNYRMGVPVFLVYGKRDLIFQGHGTVLLAGLIFPLHDSALVDYWRDGIHQARHYLWSSSLSLNDIMNDNLQEILEDLTFAGAYLGPPPLFPPNWRPLIRH